MLPRAHVAQRARPLPVAGEAGSGEGVERHPLGARGENALRDADPSVKRLDGPDVEVLAGMARRHDRELFAREVELLAAARAEERDEPERLDRGAEGDDPVRVAEQPEHPAGGVDLDDVPAVDRLHDAVADLAHEDGRHGPASLPRGGGTGRDPWLRRRHERRA
jgi:hypothetical protein